MVESIRRESDYIFYIKISQEFDGDLCGVLMMKPISGKKVPQQAR